MSYLKNIRHPERYLGQSKSPPFFESWYYKIVDAAGKNRFTVIPAIFKSEYPQSSYACVQIIDGSSGKTALSKYAASRFKAEKKQFTLNIGANHFSDTRLALNIKSTDFRINGTLVLGEITSWPNSIWSPGLMGLAGYKPNNPFNRKVVSLNHNLIGHLNFNGRKIDFTGGKGYIEKVWGKIYPTDQIWMQSNNFSTYGTSFVGSVTTTARTPKAKSRFTIGLHHKGFLHRFATHNWAKTQSLNVTDETVEWVVSSRQKTLEIVASRAKEVILFGATHEGFSEPIGQTLSSQIQLTLKDNQSIIMQDSGQCAALEVHGDTDILIATQQPKQTE